MKAEKIHMKVAHLLRVLQQKGIHTYLLRIQNFVFHFPFGYYYWCFLCFYPIAVAAVDKGYAFLFFGRGAVAANHFSC